MKYSVIVLTNLLSILIILGVFDAYHAVIYFVIAGQIPGTNVYLDSNTMLVICMIPIGFMLGRISVWVYGSVLDANLLKQQA